MTKQLRRIVPTAVATALVLLAGGLWTELEARDNDKGKASATRRSGSSGSSSSSGGSGSTRSAPAPKGDHGAARTRTGSQSSRDGRSDRFSGRHSHHGRHHGRSSLHLGFRFGYPYYYGDYYAPYGYYYRPWYYGPPPVADRSAYDLGALDLNVRPLSAQVYLNGQYIGKADRYNGFPGYLWLERGTYELIFYRPGLRTEVRTVTVYPDLTIDVPVEMLPGESVPVEQLTRVVPVEPDAVAARRIEVGPDGERSPAPGAVGRVRVDVQPADASVYLDGGFLGTAEELSGDGLRVAAGPHTLEFVRPGFQSRSVDLTVAQGEEVELDVELEDLRRR